MTMPSRRYHISRELVTIDASKTIAEAIEAMNAHKVSCILLVDEAQEVVGVLTERDVLRRLTLLEMKDKLTRAVGTIATREVFFAEEGHLHESIVRLHFEKGVRHFPVRRGEGKLVSDVVGMVTLTDVVRAFLADDVKRSVETHAAAATTSAHRPLAVICHAVGQLELYREIFRPAGFEPQHIADPGAFFTRNLQGATPLVFDFDGFPRAVVQKLVAPTKKYPGHLIMTASDPAIIQLFQPYMDHARQTVAVKPLDRDYLVWLLTTKWVNDRRT